MPIHDPSPPLLRRLHGWLSPADRARPADLTFVLAGQMSRKHYALQLFREGLAPRLLFSVSRFEIRRFSNMALPVQLDLLKLAQDLPPPQRHFFVLFQGGNVTWRMSSRGGLAHSRRLHRWRAGLMQIRKSSRSSSSATRHIYGESECVADLFCPAV